MQKQAEQLKLEEIRQAELKRERAKVMMGEVEEANKKQVTVKENKK